MSVLELLRDGEQELARGEARLGWTEPMLATLTEDYFSDPGWLYERKVDGERVLAIRTPEGARLVSRNRNELGGTYPEIAEALGSGQPGGSRFLVDGEVVAFEGNITSFSRLQGRLGVHDPRRARATGIAVTYYAFDLLHVDSTDLTQLPLRRRKALLKHLLRWEDPLRFMPHRNETGESYREEACRRGWEGVIAKRADGPYRHGRSTDWLKFKCSHGQELVVGGYTDPRGSRHDFGALLVGHHDDGDLVYAGKIGTGFDDATLRRLGTELRARERGSSPFDRGGAPRSANWVEPELVCQVAFTEWTRDGRLRHPRYLGLRDDKDPADVVREAPRSIEP